MVRGTKHGDIRKMGTLLMLYEYQRANNKCNSLQRSGIRLNNQLERYTKRVSKMENLFEKQKSRLESQWTAKSKQFSSAISMGALGGPNQLINAVNSIVIGGIPLGSVVNVASMLASVNTSTDSANQQNLLSALSTVASQAQAAMQTLITEAQEADEAQLDEKQEAQLEPISEKETDLQGQVTTNDALETIWEQRRDAAKEKLPEEIKNGTAHYGIG